MNTNQNYLNRMTIDIRMRGLSEHTLRGYIRNAKAFLEYCGKPADELDESDAREFLIHLMREGKVENVTINQYNAAIRFFFAVTLNRTINYLQPPHFKRQKKLPEMLSRDEISTLINDCVNLKHKALFQLAYGSGLRVSEIATLRTKDVDAKTMRVFVRAGKGKKDRYTLLSNECLCTLREYWTVYGHKHPEGWIFLGQGGYTHISTNAIGEAFRNRIEQLGIKKNVSIHTLRHAFATHLLEDGATIFQIKELLGHTSLASTIIYLHIANTTAGVASPADTLVDHG